MATQIATDFKDLLTIKQKSRLDSLCDQYNRIFMVRMMLVCTTIMALSWYTDEMNCMVPSKSKSAAIDEKFVSAACWIQGLYVYTNLLGQVENVAYFGIPKNMDHEGMLKGTNELCGLRPKLGVKSNPDCEPMKRSFYLQYQYMPFLIGALAILYYIPYVAFRVVNKDKALLKEAIKASENCAAKDLIQNHFKPGKNTEMTIVVILNFIIKVLYVFSNVVTFIWLNHVLGENYIDYGSNYVQWSRLNRTTQHDYMGIRGFPKPGNILLPPFGYCELYESARDLKTTLSNKHKFVCELSQHILYQYCLLVLWFAIFVGIVASIIGVIKILLAYVCIAIRIFKIRKDGRSLHFRNIELLEYVRKKDPELFKECDGLLNKKVGSGNNNSLT